VAAVVADVSKKAEEKMIVMVDLSGARQVLLAAVDLSGSQVDLSGVIVSLTQKVLPSEEVKEWASAVSATQESEAPGPVDDKKEDTPQS
jgi:hypothetical protein